MELRCILTLAQFARAISYRLPARKQIERRGKESDKYNNMATKRLYYDDSFLGEFDATALSCEPAAHSAAPAWEIVLDQTAFYPTSGGQPNDLGTLGGANVVDVRDDGERVVHVVDGAIALGSVHGVIDWPRRFDHMQQHTGQHLLSAVFHTTFGLPTVSFHLGADICTIDLRANAPSEELLARAEREANKMVFEDRPVTVRYGTAEELARQGVRKEVERSGVLRAIDIAGMDLQPCGGTHVRSTGQIGMILVRRCAKVRQDWRVEFVCGARAERTARQDYATVRSAADKLNCAPAEVAATAERALTERDAHFKALRAALARLAETDAALVMQTAAPNSQGVRAIARVFQEDTQPEYLSQLATQLAKFEKTIAVLARFPCGHVILAQHPSAGNDMTALLKQILARYAGKGGGARDFARGRLADAANAEAAVAFGQELLSK